MNISAKSVGALAVAFGAVFTAYTCSAEDLTNPGAVTTTNSPVDGLSEEEEAESRRLVAKLETMRLEALEHLGAGFKLLDAGMETGARFSFQAAAKLIGQYYHSHGSKDIPFVNSTRRKNDVSSLFQRAHEIVINAGVKNFICELGVALPTQIGRQDPVYVLNFQLKPRELIAD